MASRKPTSTTQRRLNLLKSTYLTNGGRNATNGLFRLGPQSLTEVNMLTGRMRRGSYFLVREELRKILRDNPAEPFISTYRHNQAGTSTFRVAISDDLIQIGCKRFVGKTADALRQWALQN